MTATKTLSHQRFQLIFAGIVLLSAVLYSIRNLQYSTGVFNDDAAYVLAAENILQPDPSLRALVRPDFPFPGLPYLLAPLVKVVSPHWVLMEWLSVLVGILTVVLFGLWMKKWLSMKETLFVLAIYAFNPVIAKYSGVLMPAIYFLAAVLGCFLLLESLLEKPSPIKAWALGLVLGWGSFVRPEGALLCLSVPVALALERRWKDLARTLAIPALLWGLFLVRWGQEYRPHHTEYGGDLTALWSYWSTHGLEVFRFSATMLKVLFLRTLFVLRLPSNLYTTVVSAWIIILCFVLMGIGVRSLWEEGPRRRRVLGSVLTFCALYFLVHVLWHIAIPRYCVVLLPFVLVFLLRGVLRCLASSPRRAVWTSVILSLLILRYSYRNAIAMHQALWAPNPLNSAPWKSLAWLSDHTPENARILSSIAPNITLYTRRSAVSVIYPVNEEDFLYTLTKMHVDYVVDKPFEALESGIPTAMDPNRSWGQMRAWMQANPLRYVPVFQEPSEKVAIYRVQVPPGFVEAYEKYLLAVKAMMANQAGDALKALHESLRAFPGLASANNALGIMDYSMHTNLKEAEQAFQEAIKSRPDYTLAMLNLARLYHLTGEEGKSAEVARKGLEVSASNGTRTEFVQNIRLGEQNHELDLPQDLAAN